MLLRKGKAHPCLVIDYSALGAAVSAAITPAIGTRLTIGQIPARVARLFDVGFAVTFEPAPDAEDIERLLEAPAEWLNTVRVVAPQRIDTSEPGETLDVYGGD